MIKEEQDSDGEPNGIRNLQYGKTAGDFSCYLKIDLLEKCADIHIRIKGHDGKCRAKKRGKADKDHFEPAEKRAGSGFFFIGKNEVRFADRCDRKFRFFFLDHVDKIHDRHDIPSRLF